MIKNLETEEYLRESRAVIDNALDKTKSIFKLVNLVSMRAIEISEGAAKLVDAKKMDVVLDVALKEIRDGKVSYKKAKKNAKK